MPSPTPLSSLRVHRFRARLRPERALRLPPSRRLAVLRGAFAITLRKLVCHDLALACSACPLRASCAYPAVFDPRALRDEPLIRRIADPPRPFIVRETSPGTAERTEPDASLEIDLHVVGTAHAHVPYLLATVDALARAGLGPDRVRLRLDRVEVVDRHGLASGVALDPATASMRPTAPAVSSVDLARPGDAAPRVVRIRFLTPTLLRDAGADLRDAPFGPLLRRLRARVGALATLYGDGPLGDDPRAASAAAESVSLRASTLAWQRELRHSTRTGERHPLEGFTGEATYEGDLAPWMPLLRLAELLHVGKHASFGLGRIDVQVLA